jgi:hypothetical protein
MERLFGTWETDGVFDRAPFPHVVVDSFFTPETLAALQSEVGDPIQDAGWKRYWNPLEKKYALNTFAGKPTVQAVFAALQSDAFVQRIAALTGLPTLQSDPHLHGAGLHYHPRGGKLDMHLDYSVHPLSGLERKVNLIVYLNETWESAWGGGLELWDRAFTHAVATIPPSPNRAVVFQTSDLSYHGLPTPIQCPESTGRKSLAVYYVAPLTPTSAPVRYKAEFRPLPHQPVDDRLAALYSLRATRLLTPEDLWETWDADGNGFW